MEAGGFVSRQTSLDASGVDRRVAASAAGTDFRILGGRLMTASEGLLGSFSPSTTGEQDFVSVLHRSPAETPTSAEADMDYEGLPQGASTSTHMLAGSVAGIMEHCLMYPIDCVKVNPHRNGSKHVRDRLCVAAVTEGREPSLTSLADVR